MTDFTALSFEDSRLDLLRRRIGWLCQTLRFALVAYCLWIFVSIATFWSDEAQVVSRFASLKVDVDGIQPLNGSPPSASAPRPGRWSFSPATPAGDCSPAISTGASSRPMRRDGYARLR